MNQDHGREHGPGEPAPRLLSSNRVEGVAVHSREGDKLGTVAAFIFDRFTGQTEYIVVAIGGLLGVGANYHPLPWRLATYNPGRDGYTIAIDKATLSSGPSFKHASDAAFDRAYADRVANYYQGSGPIQ